MPLLEQGEGAGAAGPKPEQAGTRNKKLRRDGEVRNLSQQQPEERKSVMARSRRWSTKSRLVLVQLGLRAGLGMEVGQWVRNVAVATHVILVGASRRVRREAAR